MNIFTSLFRRSEKRRTFAHLIELDDRLLRDIGLNRSDLHLMMVGVPTAHRSRRLDHD
jgi:uncharacterized protein YjiS (DUF1127 family)